MMEIIKNKADWKKIIKDHYQKLEDTYFTYEYFDIFANNFNVKPEGFFWEDNNIKIFWTHLVRNINTIKLFEDYDYYDLITPYGYGGPLVLKKTENVNNLQKSIEIFFNKYKNYAIENHYISEFIRFHPFLKNWELLTKFLNTVHLNDVVFVDLTKDIEQLWRECRKDRKRNIKRTKNLNCTIDIIFNPEKKNIEEFLQVYNITMDRNVAGDKYYFSYNFFKDHFKLLKDNIILVNAEYNRGIIGSSIFFFRNNNIHYHLSGSKKIKNVSPSEFILWEIIKWSKEKGLKKFLLGGGRGKDDSLFEFKKGLSKTYLPFYTGKTIFNSKIYEELVELNPLATEDPSFFPQYRVGMDENII